MPSYEICYLNSDGSLACTLAASCADDMQAKVLAHAMKLSEYKCFEVWTDRALVYERPARIKESERQSTKPAAGVIFAGAP